jgi:hypothetical protein
MPKKKTTEEFIEDARKAHGEKYDYSKVEYVNNNKKVCIICKEHGEFMQLPRIHTGGFGCPKCAGVYSDTETFIKKASKKYHNFYDYSKVVYNNSTKPVTIICPDHGEFTTTPNKHLYASGCPGCTSRNLSRGIRKVVMGVGINDYDGLVTKDTHVSIIYDIWVQMLRRCYSEESLIEKPMYRGCSVCEEWHSFSAFLAWADDASNGYREGYAIDKDIIKHGNKVYSPDACVFAPDRINTLFTKAGTLRGDTPIGVGRVRDKFRARLNIDGEMFNGGLYTDMHEAFLRYKELKEAYIKRVADEYYERGEICDKLYNALLKYEVLETD